MGIYRKKPVEVEAFQWTGDKDQEAEPVWMSEALRNGDIIIYKANSRSEPVMEIHTTGSLAKARIGDYIVRGIKGELYPCKPDIFAASYEKVEDEISN